MQPLDLHLLDPASQGLQLKCPQLGPLFPNLHWRRNASTLLSPSGILGSPRLQRSSPSLEPLSWRLTTPQKKVSLESRLHTLPCLTIIKPKRKWRVRQQRAQSYPMQMRKKATLMERLGTSPNQETMTNGPQRNGSNLICRALSRQPSRESPSDPSSCSLPTLSERMRSCSTGLKTPKKLDGGSCTMNLAQNFMNPGGWKLSPGSASILTTSTPSSLPLELLTSTQKPLAGLRTAMELLKLPRNGSQLNHPGLLRGTEPRVPSCSLSLIERLSSMPTMNISLHSSAPMKKLSTHGSFASTKPSGTALPAHADMNSLTLPPSKTSSIHTSRTPADYSILSLRSACYITSMNQGKLSIYESYSMFPSHNYDNVI